MPYFRVIEDRERDLAVMTKRFADGMQLPVAFAWLQPSYPTDDLDRIKNNLIEERNPKRLNHLRQLSKQFNIERTYAEHERSRQINYVRDLAAVFNEQEKLTESKSLALPSTLSGGTLTYGFSTFDESLPLWRLEDDYKVPQRLLKLLKFDLEIDRESTVQSVFKTTSLSVTEPDPATGHDINFVDVYFAKNHFNAVQVRNAAARVSQRAMENVQKVCAPYMGYSLTIPKVSQ